MRSTGLTGEDEAFSFPLFQTFGMFVGMLASLVMHVIVLSWKIPFPGYVHKSSKGEYMSVTGEAVEPPKPIPAWMYGLLIIPSLFDLVATALCMFGLRHVSVSVYQMLRGGAIVFVALLKQFILGDKLKKFMWVGVGWNVVSIILVGAVAMYSSMNLKVVEGAPPQTADEQDPLFGVFLILMGAFVQSLQYAFEEKVMSMEIAAPPLLLIGMEGFWGTLVCLFVLYPLAYHLPGSDHGSIENPYNTYALFMNSKEIQNVFIFYFLSIFCYNILACLVTYMLNSVWHAILDNFRPITVWSTDLFIFYCFTRNFGESWTIYSYIQLLGMFVLLYGTAIYNAPNPGSLKLEGGCQSCFMDFSDEYADREDELEDESMVQPDKKNSQYLSTMSPFMSPSKRRPSTVPVRESDGRSGVALQQRGYGTDAQGVAMLPLNTKQNSFA